VSTTSWLASQVQESGSLVGQEALLPPAEEWRRPSNSVADRWQEQVELLNDGSFFVSSNPAMLSIREQIEKIADYDVPVLILGESGTGKEVVARLLHSRSSRARHRFLKVNCAALPASLLESELFGYERGAFTGAIRCNPGKFEFCDSGTILLDEIGEIPPALQAKLLHVLQDKTFSRLGGHASIQLDVRVIAATNVDIDEALESGRLRKDLYYRLNTFIIRIPPLRSRPDEIPLLFDHFIRRFAANYECQVAPLSRRLIAACMDYPWPGNIRELQNFAQRLLIQGDQEQALQELLASGQAMAADNSALNSVREAPSLDLKVLGRQVKSRAEKPTIIRILQETRYNRKAAARRLKISYKGLLLKLREYGLDGKTSPLYEQELEIRG
jgi:two-component system, NtrC family, response regulator AtoC